MIGAFNPAMVGMAANALGGTPGGTLGQKGGGQTQVAPGANRLGQPQPGMAAPMGQPAPNVYQQSANAYSNALAGTQGAMMGAGNVPQVTAAGYNPAMASSQGYNSANAGSQGYGAATVAGMNLDPYMNPYTDRVINTSLRQLGDAQQNSLNSLGAQASAAGAFGGSRHGVAEGVTNIGYGQQKSDMIGGLNQANFMNALNVAQSDAGSQNSARAFGAGAANNASLSNQAAANAASAFRAGAANNASLANQASSNAAGSQFANAQTQASQANQNAYFSGLQNQLSAAGQMGNLSQQGFNFGQQIGNQQGAQGALQQGMQQMMIDAAKAQYAGWAGAPQASLGLPMAAVGGGAQLGQGTTTQTQQRGLFDFLALGAQALGGLCWVAREVYGEQDSRWLEFREWLLNGAPKWLLRLYARHGEAFAGVVRRVPVLKRILRPLMDRARRAAGFVG